MAQRKGISFDTAGAKQIKRMNAIAKVSAQLFATKGYLETSIDDIAAAAKVTKGGIYHYFACKTDILYFICSTYVELDIENVAESLSSIESPAEKIKFIIHRHIDHYTNHTAAAKVLLNEACNLPPRPFKEMKARERRYFDIVTGVLSEFPGAEGRRGVIASLAFMLFGMMNWIYSWYDPKGEIGSEELSQLIYEVFMNGINSPALLMEGGALPIDKTRLAGIKKDGGH